MTKFKVGERVKFINNGGYILHDNQQAGKIIAKNPSDMYEVRVDNYRMTLSFNADELISETPTLKYTTEKRKANVGERILITNAEFTFGDYDNGDVLTVVDSFGKDAVLVDGEDFPQITHEEYEVIIADKPSKNARITQLESKVAALESALALVQKRRKPAVSLTQTPTVHNVTVNIDSAKSAVDIGKLITEGLAKGMGAKPKPTPNEQRKAVIERAKAFVADGCDRWFRVEFHVNSDKRTVVALLRTKSSNNVFTRAIAKCAPDDVFNADIGKAIALGRALGLDVSEFENAVKPTEVVVGHKVIRKVDSYRGVLTVISDDGGCNYPKNETKLSTTQTIASRILDDTGAQY